MAEPSLKDVLDAIANLEKGQRDVEKGQRDVATRMEKLEVKVTSEFADVRRAEVRSERARQAFEGAMDGFRDETKHAIEDLSAKVDVFESKMNKRFDDLDEELTLHAKVHKEIEKDVIALKRRPARTAARAPRRPRTR